MKRLVTSCAALLALGLAACGSSSSDNTPVNNGFPQPAGTVVVNFGPVDDTANQVFTAGQLKWKGSMLYDATTRKITYDSTWGGGTCTPAPCLAWAPLYDDGPWDQGGHEPIGQVAGDHKWSVTVFATPPATASQAYEYGLIDVVYETSFGNGWIWRGANGTFSVAAGATAPVNAAGITLLPFGTTNMKLMLDTHNLGAGTWSTTTVKVKGSATAWSEVTLVDDGTKGDATAGDGIYTMELSQYVGTGKQFMHSGLLHTGDKPEFIWVLNGVEYKDANANAQTTGVSAETKPSGGSYAAATVQLYDKTATPAGNGNTYITVP